MRRHPPTLATAVAMTAGALILACTGCGEEPPGRTSDPLAGPGPIRLADLLGPRTVVTPLTEVTAVSSVLELEDAPREVLLSEDFGSFDMQAAQWPTGIGASVGEIDGERAFSLRGLRRNHRFSWYVPVEPNTHYVFRCKAKASQSLNADFCAVETWKEGAVGSPFNKHYFSGKGQAIKVHWPERAEPDGTWQDGTAAFFTESATRFVAIMLHWTKRRDSQTYRIGQAEDVSDRVWFDDIRLERVNPTPEQSMALLKNRALAEGADPNLGISKHGLFPPMRLIGDVYRPGDHNFSCRYALYAPPPTELRFPVRIGENATLRFSTCLARETRPSDSARFEVLVHAGGQPKSLWHRVSTAAPKWGWHDEQLDLSAYAGQAVDIVLRTTAVVGAPHPMWGNPVVDAPVADAGSGPRNVILIAVDTLRADRLSCYGHAARTSPQLERLAGDGVLFRNVSSNATWTCPSFASILTGLVPSRHGVFAVGNVKRLPRAFDTLAERFRRAGWATHSVVFKPPLYDAGYDQGFDLAFNVPRLVIKADENLAEAMAWLEDIGHRRNFLFLHFDDPHQPFTQPAPYDSALGKSPEENGFKLPHMVRRQIPDLRSEDFRNVVREMYDGAIRYVDDRIGSFLNELEKRGLYDDAVIAFVSDHGEQLWERGMFGHGGSMLHDEVVHVPLIVKPGGGKQWARGVVRETQVTGFDVMPTLLKLAGLPVGGDVDAESLVPLLGADAPDAVDRVAVTETKKGPLALRNRRWKYILWVGDDQKSGESLFDLQADPGETDDVSTRHPEVMSRMRVQAIDYVMSHRPGRYLVVIGPPGPDSVALRIGGATSLVQLFGIPPRERKGGGFRFTGETTGPLVAVAYVEGGPVLMGSKARPIPDAGRYRAGDLAVLVAKGERGIHLFDGPPAPTEEYTPANVTDVQQLELLRALGYTGARPRTEKNR